MRIPFLTDLDSRAQVRGSRDPLGVQPIWTRLGRHVIGNLIMATTSVRDFTTLILGYWLAEKVAEEDGGAQDLETFLKWEQLAVYARARGNKDWAFRGTERVRLFLSQDDTRATLSADRAHQILSDQRIYGLWGLYTQSGRASGLLEGSPTRVSAASRQALKNIYEPVLSSAGLRDLNQLAKVLKPAKVRLDLDGADRMLMRAVAKTLAWPLMPAERDFYREHLLYGGPADQTKGLQRQLATLVEPLARSAEYAWSPSVLSSLAKQARNRKWNELAGRLDRIRVCESVLAPVGRAFAHMQAFDGRSVDSYVARLRGQWNGGLPSVDPSAFAELREELAGGDETIGDCWLELARTAANGTWSHHVEAILALNRTVMMARGGTPWIEKNGERLRVRYRDERADLPSRADVSRVWLSPYFLEALRLIARPLQES